MIKLLIYNLVRNHQVIQTLVLVRVCILMGTIRLQDIIPYSSTKHRQATMGVIQ